MEYYYVYMMGSESGRALYIGVTNDLHRRVREHRSNMFDGFTQRYRCHKLLYYEEHTDIRNAISREKQLKGWTRKRKEDLIDTMNPERADLMDLWH